MYQSKSPSTSLGKSLLDQGPQGRYVVDLGPVYRRWGVWMRTMPRVKRTMPSSATPIPVILALLASLGTAFAAHIRHAKRVGHKLTTFDTDSRLHKTKNTKTLFCVRSRLVSA